MVIILTYEKRQYVQLCVYIYIYICVYIYIYVYVCVYVCVLQRIMVFLCYGSSVQLWDCQHAKQLNSNRRRGNLIGGLQQLK